MSGIHFDFISFFIRSCFCHYHRFVFGFTSHTVVIFICNVSTLFLCSESDVHTVAFLKFLNPVKKILIKNLQCFTVFREATIHYFQDKHKRSKAVYCAACGKKFSSASSGGLKYHLMSVHGFQPNVRMSKPSESTGAASSLETDHVADEFMVATTNDNTPNDPVDNFSVSSSDCNPEDLLQIASMSPDNTDVVIESQSYNDYADVEMRSKIIITETFFFIITDGRTEGQTGGQTVQSDGRRDGQTIGRTEGRTDGWTDRRTVGLMKRWTKNYVNCYTIGSPTFQLIIEEIPILPSYLTAVVGT